MSLGLLVRRVLLAPPAVLTALEPLGHILLVLGRVIVFSSALGTRQGDQVLRHVK